MQNVLACVFWPGSVSLSKQSTNSNIDSTTTSCFMTKWLKLQNFRKIRDFRLSNDALNMLTNYWILLLIQDLFFIKKTFEHQGCKTKQLQMLVLEMLGSLVNFECQVFVLFCLAAYDQLKCQNMEHGCLRIAFTKTAKLSV